MIKSPNVSNNIDFLSLNFNKSPEIICVIIMSFSPYFFSPHIETKSSVFKIIYLVIHLLNQCFACCGNGLL